MAKKSTFKVIGESIANGSFARTKMPLSELNVTKMSKEELVRMIKEEFAKAKEAEDVDAKQVEGWGDCTLEKEVNWMKALSIKEAFGKK